MGRVNQPRACIRCHEIKPADAFDWGDGGPNYRRRRGVCRECLSLEAEQTREKKKQAEQQRKTFKQDGRWVRRCRLCGEVKALEEGFYRARAVPTGRLSEDFQYDCRACQIKRVDGYQSEMWKVDPAFRERRNAERRAWRARNEDREVVYRRRAREKVRSDPERYKAQLEMQRIGRRLRAEREGRSMRAVVLGTHTGIRLPMGPFRTKVIEAALRQRQFEHNPMGLVDGESTNDNIIGATAEFFGVSERRLWAWRAGSSNLDADAAERALIAMDLLWWEVWEPGDEGYEEARAYFEGDEDAA